MTGHQACGCLLHLSVLKRQGKISEIPSVGQTVYTPFTAVAEVCTYELCMAADEDSDELR